MVNLGYIKENEVGRRANSVIQDVEKKRRLLKASEMY